MEILDLKIEIPARTEIEIINQTDMDNGLIRDTVEFCADIVQMPSRDFTVVIRRPRKRGRNMGTAYNTPKCFVPGFSRIRNNGGWCEVAPIREVYPSSTISFDFIDTILHEFHHIKEFQLNSLMINTGNPRPFFYSISVGSRRQNHDERPEEIRAHKAMHEYWGKMNPLPMQEFETPELREKRMKNHERYCKLERELRQEIFTAYEAIKERRRKRIERQMKAEARKKMIHERQNKIYREKSNA